MIYKMNKPSANMLLSTSELNRMYHEEQVELYKKEQEKAIAEQAAIEREINENTHNINQLHFERIAQCNNRMDALLKIKEGFVTACLNKLYCESIAFPMTERDKVIGRNLVNKFVIENGAGELINSFAVKNMVLSEFSRICTKYYERAVKECVDSQQDTKEFKPIIDKGIVDDFYKELEDVDISDAAKLIRDRVADAISDFIDYNTANKIEYEEVIKQAQDKIASINGADDALAEAYLNNAKRKINDMKIARQNNIFGYMVENLTTSVLKDENLKERFINEGSVDMDGIVNSAQLIYAMLEMVNTTNMVNIDEEFIKGYLTNL